MSTPSATALNPGENIPDSDVERRQAEINTLLKQLRALGVDNRIELPQLVVSGDQSSAKSSVLEAISGIPLPTKDVLCTRFPLELVMQQATTKAFSVSIQPWSGAAEGEKRRLRAWRLPEHLTKRADLRLLPQIVDLAAQAMNLRTIPDSVSQNSRERGGGEEEEDTDEEFDLDAGIPDTRKAFSRHALRVEISGPVFPNLALVDLPGLFHAEGGQQTLGDAREVKELVLEYMSKPRTIILAILQATVEPASQIVTTLASQCDTGHVRTFGIITKPDVLNDMPNLAKVYVNVLLNKHHRLDLGFHVVRTRKLSEKDMDAAEFTKIEEALFASKPWKKVPSELMGLPNLKKQIDRIIFNHITALATPLAAEIEAVIQQDIKQLQELKSVSPTVTAEQIQEIGEKTQSLLEMAINGDYQHALFRTQNQFTAQRTASRLRHTIEQLIQSFAQRLQGQATVGDVAESATETPVATPDSTASSPTGPVKAVIERLQDNDSVPGQLDY